MAKKKGKVLTSIEFCYGKAWQYNKKIVLATPLYIILSVLCSVPLVFIPSIAVTYLSVTPDFGKFLIWFSILFGTYVILNIITSVLDTTIDWNNTFVRIGPMMDESAKKSMTIDYEFYDNSELKRKKEAAEAALWGNWQGAELVMKSVPKILISILGLVVYISYSGVIDAWLILIILGIVSGNLVCSFIASKWYAAHHDDYLKAKTKNMEIRRIADNVEQGKDIRNYELGNLFHAFFVKEYDLFKNYTKIQNRLLILPNLSDSIFGFIRDSLGYLLLTKAVIDGSITVAEFSTMIGILNGCSTFINQLSTQVDYLLKGSKDTELFVEYLKTPSTFKQEGGYPIEELPKELEIVFDDVSFTYPGMDKPTLSHLSFVVHPGEKIALVGENGAGKTTIIKLLSLFYKPTSGKITIGGVDILDFGALEYRKLLSSVNQDNILPGLPIDQVVACSDEPDEEKVLSSLEKAGLMKKIDSLPKKQHTSISQELDPDGVSLSGGQTQLLMLARALYRDGKILILDEPTAALDPIMEGRIYEKYGEMCNGKSSIFISHRLASTRFCDKILYLENGTVIEEGTHEELLKKNGEYAKMFEIQAHYYRDAKAEEAEL